jgi:hypothetical protein
MFVCPSAIYYLDPTAPGHVIIFISFVSESHEGLPEAIPVFSHSEQWQFTLHSKAQMD